MAFFTDPRTLGVGTLSTLAPEERERFAEELQSVSKDCPDVINCAADKVLNVVGLEGRCGEARGPEAGTETSVVMRVECTSSMPLFCDSISVRFLEADRDTARHLSTSGSRSRSQDWESRHVSSRYVLLRAPAAVTLEPGRNDVLLVGTPRFSGKLRPSELSVEIGKIQLSQYTLPAYTLQVEAGEPTVTITFPQRDAPLLAGVVNP